MLHQSKWTQYLIPYTFIVCFTVSVVVLFSSYASFTLHKAKYLEPVKAVSSLGVQLYFLIFFFRRDVCHLC